jgi:hypothetical protein
MPVLSLGAPPGNALSFPFAHRQAWFVVDPVSTLAVDFPAFPAQQYMQATISITTLSRRQFAQPSPQLRIRWAFGFVPV